MKKLMCVGVFVVGSLVAGCGDVLTSPTKVIKPSVRLEQSFCAPPCLVQTNGSVVSILD